MNVHADQDLFAIQPFVLPCKIGRTGLKLMALIDTDSSVNVLIDTHTAHQICEREGIEPLPLSRPKMTQDWNGNQTETIARAIYARLSINGHYEDLCPLAIASLGRHQVIIGRGWLKRHGALIDTARDELIFRSGHCQHPGATAEPSPKPKAEVATPLPSPTTILQRKKHHLPADSVTRVVTKAVTEAIGSPARAPREPPKDTKPTTGTSLLNLSTGSLNVPPAPKKPQIRQIGAAAYRRLARDKNAECFSITLKEVNELLGIYNAEVSPGSAAAEPQDEYEYLRRTVPKEYHDLIDVFSKRKADQLPQHRKYDHKIVLEGELKPGYCPLYRMSREELMAVKEYLEENLQKGFIVASSSPFASPILFVKKKDGSLRFCVDYRKLNALTRKDRYPLPLIDETLAQLSQARIMTKLDIRHAFNRIRMSSEQDEDLTTFRTRFGSYKYRVMPFGLTGGPATFQHYINDMLFDYLDVFCTAYMDDILIYSQNQAEHTLHVRKVLQRLKEAGLQADVKKCEFNVKETRFLGMIVGVKGIRMDPAKIAAITQWGTPACLTDVQAFLGFCNFYRRFIRNFSRIAKPLIQLTKKDEAFAWSEACEESFQEMKRAVTRAPTLAHFDRSKKAYVESDSSDFVSSGVLSQIGDDKLLHPVAFFSKKLVAAECNYDIYDKELLAIIRCFEEWRPELEGTELPIEVLSDHRSLEYFMSTKKLTRRQARWAEFLAGFNFVINYRPGKKNDKADALTRRTGDLPFGESDDRQQQQHQLVLTKERLHADVVKDLQIAPVTEVTNPLHAPDTVETPEPANPLGQQVAEGQAEDEFCQKVIRMLNVGQRRSREVSLPHCEVVDGLLYFRKRLVVPEDDDLRLSLLREVHETPAGGHYGVGKMIGLLKRQYWFPRMHRVLKRYIQNCHTCRRANYSREAYNGILNPLPVPERAWKDISMDYVVGLPTSKGKNAILVVMFRLTKMRHFIPCVADEEGTSAEETAAMLLRHLWKHHGLCSTAVSDRGPQFVAEVWKHLCRLLRIEARLSTAFHPETDGQTENANKDMERYLRSFINYLQDDWIDWLPMAEFSANNTESSAIKTSPFFANCGFHPRMSFDFEPDLPADPIRPRELIQREKAETMANKMKEIGEFLREEMTLAQAEMEEQAHHYRTPAPRYEVGDKVWLSTANIRTQRPSKKLDHKQIGPYEILRKLGPTSYELKLPESMRIHPVFHSSLLRLDPDDPLPNQVIPPPPPIEVEGEEEWEVQEILDSRWYYGRLQYRVKWTGYETDDSWYNADGFANSQELTAAFHNRYPNKPKPRQQGLRTGERRR